MSGPERSWLFVPGDRPERFAKAASCGADRVVLDLEDAVAPEGKAAAREHVARRLAGHSGCVRVNAVGTAWHDDDVAAVCGLPGLRQVMLPKSERPEDLAALAERLPPRVEIVALVETALGVHDATALARVPRVRRLAFGSVDFGLDAGITGTGEELLYARSRLVLASRVAGIAAPLDGVTTALDDVELLAAESARARRLGFAGKLAVHPAQIDAINRAFSPTEEEVAWARGVLAAAAAAGGAAVRVGGEMIDRPRIALAERLLAQTPHGRPERHGRHDETGSPS